VASSCHFAYILQFCSQLHPSIRTSHIRVPLPIALRNVAQPHSSHPCRKYTPSYAVTFFGRGWNQFDNEAAVRWARWFWIRLSGMQLFDTLCGSYLAIGTSNADEPMTCIRWTHNLKYMLLCIDIWIGIHWQRWPWKQWDQELENQVKKARRDPVELW